jgi:hypothetical protein
MCGADRLEHIPFRFSHDHTWGNNNEMDRSTLEAQLGK